MSDDIASYASAPQLKVHPSNPLSPAAELVAAAIQEGVETDDLGRRLHFRKPGILAEFRLVEALGPGKAENTSLVQMYTPLLWLSQIEHPADPEKSHAVALPQNQTQLDALLSELREEGWQTVLTWYAVHVMGPQIDAIEAAKKAAAEKAALKNG